MNQGRPSEILRELAVNNMLYRYVAGPYLVFVPYNTVNYILPFRSVVAFQKFQEAK